MWKVSIVYVSVEIFVWLSIDHAIDNQIWFGIMSKGMK